jgi:hypothetical protein
MEAYCTITHRFANITMLGRHKSTSESKNYFSIATNTTRRALTKKQSGRISAKQIPIRHHIPSYSTRVALSKTLVKLCVLNVPKGSSILCFPINTSIRTTPLNNSSRCGRRSKNIVLCEHISIKASLEHPIRNQR